VVKAAACGAAIRGFDPRHSPSYTKGDKDISLSPFGIFGCCYRNLALLTVQDFDLGDQGTFDFFVVGG
jgi:hypothetical protein